MNNPNPIMIDYLHSPINMVPVMSLLMDSYYVYKADGRARKKR